MPFIVAKAQLRMIVSLVQVDWRVAAKADKRNDVLARHSSESLDDNFSFGFTSFDQTMRFAQIGCIDWR